jgi:hypothetical protein
MACYLSPFEDKDELTEQEYGLAVDALGRVWATVGFEPFRGGVWVMDPADVKQRDCWRLLLKCE